MRTTKNITGVSLMLIICASLFTSFAVSAAVTEFSLSTGFDGDFAGDGTFSDTDIVRVGMWGTTNAHTVQLVTVDRTDTQNPVLKLATTSGKGGINYELPSAGAGEEYKINISFKFKTDDSAYTFYTSLFNADVTKQNNSLQNFNQTGNINLVFSSGGNLSYGDGDVYAQQNAKNLGAITPGEWYIINSIVTVTGTSRVSVSTTVLNEDGSLFGSYKDTVLSGNAVKDPAYFTIMGEKGIYIDDLSINNSESGLSVSDYEVSDNFISLKFSTPLKTTTDSLDGTVLKRIGTDEEIAVLSQDVAVNTINLEADGLKPGAEYEIVFSENSVLDIFDRVYSEKPIICVPSDGNYVQSARLIDLEDNEVIPRAISKNSIKGMKLKLNSPAATPNATLESYSDSIDVAVTGSGTEYTLNFGRFMKTGTEYTLTVDYGAESPYIYKFTTTDDGELSVKSFALYKGDKEVTSLNELSDNDILTLRAVIYNTTGTAQNIYLSYGLYSDSILKGMNFTSGTLEGNISGDIISKNLTYKADMQLDEICGFLIQSIETPKPMYITPLLVK